MVIYFRAQDQMLFIFKLEFLSENNFSVSLFVLVLVLVIILLFFLTVHKVLLLLFELLNVLLS